MDFISGIKHLPNVRNHNFAVFFSLVVFQRASRIYEHMSFLLVQVFCGRILNCVPKHFALVHLIMFEAQDLLLVQAKFT